MRADDILHTHGVFCQDTALLSLAGELDAATAPLADHAVADAMANHPRQLELDVAGLTFCDTAGARALRRARRTAHTQHTSFRLVGTHPRLHHMLTLLCATDLFPPEP